MFQQYRVKHATVEACEVALVVDGRPSTDRQFVINGIGVIDRETFLSMYEPTAVAVPTPAPSQLVRRKATKKVAAKRAAAPQPITEPRPAPSPKLTMRDAVRQAVAERPRTNIEIAARVRELGVEGDSKVISTVTCQLRSDNEMYKGEFPDVKWYPTQKLIDARKAVV
jgi:hypothetical protein